VRALLGVLTAVELDDQAAFGTEKVDDVPTDWNLPAKTKSFQRPPTKERPELTLGIR
jgi:hypothetical protein